MDDDYPKIEFDGGDYFVTGCVVCEENIWTIASNGKDFIAKCANCNHAVKLNTDVLRDRPNQKAIDTRFFS